MTKRNYIPGIAPGIQSGLFLLLLDKVKEKLASLSFDIFDPWAQVQQPRSRRRFYHIGCVIDEF